MCGKPHSLVAPSILWLLDLCGAAAFWSPISIGTPKMALPADVIRLWLEPRVCHLPPWGALCEAVSPPGPPSPI